MSERIMGLVKERDGLLRRKRDIEEELITTLVKEDMVDCFTINWKKLYRFAGLRRDYD